MAFYHWKFSMGKHGFYLVSENLPLNLPWKWTIDLPFDQNWWKFSMERHGLYLVSVNLPWKLPLKLPWK